MKIEINGKKYKVTERLGFNHSVGYNCYFVDDGGIEKMAIKQGKTYRFWTFEDRIGRKI